MNMPLLDHFHPPLHPTRPWESFHAAWAHAIMERLNQALPARYFAAIQVHLGSRVEADVAEFDTEVHASVSGNGHGGLATEAPPATHTIAASFPDDVEVRVFDTREGVTLVAVVELVSPGNKDREEMRASFAFKCAAYLQRGIGLIVVDVVANRQANLHNHLMNCLHQPGAEMPAPGGLYATAYRPARRQEQNLIDLWLEVLLIGQDLPELPLALRGGGCLLLDLEATYMHARQSSRL
jgi:hypothetical protein